MTIYDTHLNKRGFDYNPADRRYPLLFELGGPLDDLEGLLLSEYAGKTMTMDQIYEKQNVGRPYIRKSYKDVLVKMEAEGHISADPAAENRPCRKGLATFADEVKVTINSPRRGSWPPTPP